MNTLNDRRGCENPDGCPGWVDVASADPFDDAGAQRECDTCGGRHEVRFRGVGEARFIITRVEWSPKSMRAK